MVKKFDLNIDKILESWDPCHAVREIISNALDEQILTGTKEIQVYKDGDSVWHIRDFGRGLSYDHLIQSENPEKLVNSRLIGKFGIGLKDALATLWRHGISASISSKHGYITLEKCSKHEFEDLLTLHACIESPIDNRMEGTEVLLDGCNDAAIQQAKAMFLHFSNSGTIESTDYGDVVQRGPGQDAIVYLNGLRIATESNFLFSYNITSPTASIRKGLNRERMNVGRAAYSDRIKSILTACSGETVLNSLAEDLQLLSADNNHDELDWLEVQRHACTLLNARKNVVFVTDEERTDSPQLVHHAQQDGFQAVTIPERLRAKVTTTAPPPNEKPVQLLSEYAKTFNESFQYTFVDKNDLSPNERDIFNLTDEALELCGGRPLQVKDIKISETMRQLQQAGFDANGVWLEREGAIVLKRSLLKSKEEFLSTLFHEVAHAISGASDISSEFEHSLTKLLGKVASKALDSMESLPSSKSKPSCTIENASAPTSDNKLKTSSASSLEKESKVPQEQNTSHEKDKTSEENKLNSWWKKYFT